MGEPICAACGRPISVCTADPEGCAPAGEPSKEALEEACRLATGVLESYMTGNRADPERDIAAALQRHMDRTTAAEAELTEEIEAHRVTLEDRASWESRAMDLEARLAMLKKELAAMNALHDEAWQRAETAEAQVHELETKLAAWEAARDRELIRRTELQDTLTEVKERLQAILRALQ